MEKEKAPTYYYEVKITCDNCQESSKVKIPKGIPVKNTVFECPNCGVKLRAH